MMTRPRSNIISPDHLEIECLIQQQNRVTISLWVTTRSRLVSNMGVSLLRDMSVSAVGSVGVCFVVTSPQRQRSICGGLRL